MRAVTPLVATAASASESASDSGTWVTGGPHSAALASGRTVVARASAGRTYSTSDLIVQILTISLWPGTRTAGPFPRPAAILAYSSQAIYGLAFDPSGGTLLAAGADGTIRLYRVATRTLIAAISTGSPMLGLACAGSPGLLATIGEGGARIWDINASQLAITICRQLKTPVSRQAWDDYLPEFPYTPICR